MYSCGSTSRSSSGFVEADAVGHIAVQRVVGRGLVGDDVGDRSRAGRARAARRRRCRRGPPTGRDARARPPRTGRWRRRDRPPARRGSGARAAAGRRQGSTSTHSATPPFMVTASGCAPPMPPSPPVRVIVPRQRPAEVLVGDLGERLVGALQDSLGADVDPRSRRHLAVHDQAEVLESRKYSQRRPRRHEHASWRSARGARARGCGTRRPACRTGQAESRRARSRSVAHDGVERRPAARGPAGAAVHDQVVRALGHLGVEVVHAASAARPQHPMTSR